MYQYSATIQEGLLLFEAKEVENSTEILDLLRQLPEEASLSVGIHPPIDNVDAIQIVLQPKKRKLFKKLTLPLEYTLDIIVKDTHGEDKLWYISDAMNYDGMHQILTNFVENQKLPPYGAWLNATKDMIR